MKLLVAVAAQAGPLLKSARKEAGLSQADVARLLGISQSRVSEMELNPGSISLDQLLALCAVLRLEVVLQDKAPPGRAGATPAGAADAGW